jgi:hypothetical protein
MKNQTLSENGISTTKELGTEAYTTFSPAHRPNQILYQYDYRHTDGKLFSCVAPTLEKCREKRDEWLNNN